MSLVYRIHSLVFDPITHPDAEKRREWIASRNLRDKYSNQKEAGGILKDGHIVYKQRSNAGKVDHTQTVRTQLEPGIWAIGEYKNPKFKTLRPKKNSDKVEAPVSE